MKGPDPLENLRDTAKISDFFVKDAEYWLNVVRKIQLSFKIII